MIFLWSVGVASGGRKPPEHVAVPAGVGEPHENRPQAPRQQGAYAPRSPFAINHQPFSPSLVPVNSPMPDVRPFRGVRYDIAKVGAMSDVVAPPYDVIGPDLQSALYQKSPYNVIRLELNREEAGDSPESNRYIRAANLLKDWRRNGILADDPHPAFYVYHQTFDVEGRSYTRRGFLARVKLEPFGQGRIFPHEQTLSGPKADRLALYKATEFNLSPIFGLYPDASNAVLAAVRSTEFATEHRSRPPIISAS